MTLFGRKDGSYGDSFSDMGVDEYGDERDNILLYT